MTISATSGKSPPHILTRSECQENSQMQHSHLPSTSDERFSNGRQSSERSGNVKKNLTT